MIDPDLYPVEPDDELKPDESLDRLYANRKSYFAQPDLPPPTDLTPAAAPVRPGISYVQYVNILTGATHILQVRSGETLNVPGTASVPFSFQIDTRNTSTYSSASNQYQAPFKTGITTGSYYIDFGDGNSLVWNEGDSEVLHTYSEEGVYDLIVVPTGPKPTSSDGGIWIAGQGAAPAFKDEGAKFTAINSWGDCCFYFGQSTDLRFENMNTLPDGPVIVDSNQFDFKLGPLRFADFSTWNDASNPFTGSGQGIQQNVNVPVEDYDINFNLHFIPTALNSAFAYNRNVNCPLDNWNVENVSNFSGAFAIATRFNQDLTSWDVSSGTTFASMFSNCTAFQNGGVGGVGVGLDTWNTSLVTNMSFMFINSHFNQYIGSWDVSNVTNFFRMFRQSRFNQDIGNWDMSGPKNAGEMFNYAYSFNNGDPAGFAGGGVGVGMDNWDVSQWTSLQQFLRSTPFNQYIGSWDVSNIVYAQNAFDGSSFNRDVSGWNTVSLVNASEMFANNHFDQDLGAWPIPVLSNATNMFRSTGALSTPNYDSLLIGWGGQAPNLQSGVTLSTIPCQYTLAAASARNVLTGTYGWTIVDQGQVPLATPTVAGYQSTTLAVSNPFAIDMPTGIQVGELLVAFVANDYPIDGATMGTPTGWTQVLQNGGATADSKFGVWYKVADGTEGSTISFSWDKPGGYSVIGWVMRVQGADITNPIEVIGTYAANAFSSSATAPAAITSNDNCLAFAILSFDGNDAEPITLSGTGWDASFPAGQVINYPNPATNALTAGWITKEIPTADTTQDLTMNFSATDSYGVQQFVIKGA